MLKSTNKTKKRSRHVWTKEEEEALLDVLEEIVANGGQFIAGTTRKIEVKLQQLLPESGLKASPHIDSKMKAWKRQYSSIFYMLNTSGFGSNDEKKCIKVDSDEARESYVQSHKDAKGWRGKPFPLYERFAKI